MLTDSMGLTRCTVGLFPIGDVGARRWREGRRNLGQARAETNGESAVDRKTDRTDPPAWAGADAARLEL